MKRFIWIVTACVAAMMFTACAGTLPPSEPATSLTVGNTTTEKTAVTHRISPTDNVTTTTWVYNGTVPSDAVLLALIDATGAPVVGAELSCGMPPDEHGLVAEIVWLMGETDENGHLLCRPSEWGEREFWVAKNGNLLYEGILDIQPDDLGTVMQVNIP